MSDLARPSPNQPRTLLAVEQRFQNLRECLAYPSSPRQRLQAIDKFLGWLGNEAEDYEPYLLELGQHVPALLGDLNEVGGAPEAWRAFWERLRALQAQVPALATIAGWPEAISKLQALLIAAFACAGDVAASVALIEPGFATKPPAWLQQLENEPMAAPLALITQARERAQAQHPEIAEALQGVIAQWPATAAENERIAVPVLERALSLHFEERPSGTLRRVAVRILAITNAGRDEVDFNAHVAGAAVSSFSPAHAPIAAARCLLAETHPRLASVFFTARIVLDAAHAWHEGGSANLAIAGLFYCAVLQSTDQREQFHLAGKIAITGDLDEKGETLPVDAATLGEKVQTVFFSTMEYLVVPKSQLVAAENAVEELARRYPNRRLTVIGVRHLREIFYDRRLAVRRRAGIARHLARTAWRKRFTVMGLATILALTLIIGKLLYGPLDKNPRVGVFAGESLLIKNKKGDVVDEIFVGPATVQRANSPGYDNELQGLHYVAFFDVDGDSLNEVFWLQWNDEKTAQPGMICCKSVGEDTLRWSISLRRTLNFPRKPDVKSDYFYPKQIVAGDFDGDGRGELFVNSSQDFFPALVMKLEASTGRELGHYVHVGQLNAMKMADLDQDGITEILLCGINNAFRKACLVVLDPRFIAGHSPWAGDYELTGYSAGLEKNYVLIPRTAVGDAFAEESKNNIALALFLEQARRNFFLLIRDASGPTPPLSSRQIMLYGYFGFDLRVQGFGTHDDYDLVAEKLQREGRLRRMPDFAYFEEYRKTMLYWDGAAWRNEPVMNKWYLKAREE